MLFKVFAFGLAALTLVRAAPALQVAISDNVDFDPSVETAEFNTFNEIQPGTYEIYNVASGAQLRSNGGPGLSVFVADDPYKVGPYALWKVVPAGGSNQFKVHNLGVDSDINVHLGELITGFPSDQKSDSFTIVPGGGQENIYIVSVPAKDSVWTVVGPIESYPHVTVQLQTGHAEQLWQFKRIELD